MHIAYYITGHGYGHAIRSATIANNFSSATRVTFRTAVPESFFKREMKRDYSHAVAEFDCGCLQHTGVSVDITATLQHYSRISLHNHAVFDKEVDWCKENRVDAIVSDIPPFVFSIAESLHIPSIAVTNFTWYDIYQEYTGSFKWFEPVLEEMKNQYRKADRLLSLFPSLPMEYFRSRQAASIVGRRGRNCRADLLNAYGISRNNKKIGLIYVGDFGMSNAQWKKMETFSEWEFFGIQDLPGSPGNYHKVDFTRISYPDIIASSDCVIGKLGYGVVSECMINATPLVYLPRNNFAEYPVLENAVVEWGGGVKCTETQFVNIDWKDTFDLLPERKMLDSVIDNGAALCAKTIETFVEEHGNK